jgi:hypothetical protein
MAIYELWLEVSFDRKYIGHYDRVPPEKGNANFSTGQMDSPMAAAQAIRAQVRKVFDANDQFRIRNRISIYDNLNDALEDMMRS